MSAADVIFEPLRARAADGQEPGAPFEHLRSFRQLRRHRDADPDQLGREVRARRRGADHLVERARPPSRVIAARTTPTIDDDDKIPFWREVARGFTSTTAATSSRSSIPAASGILPGLEAAHGSQLDDNGGADERASRSSA